MTPHDAAPGSRGFTLIEVLVVLLIMGLLVGLVSVTAQPDARQLTRIEAERLMALLNLAAEESQFTGKAIAWTADGSGYRFQRVRSDNEWTDIRDSDLLRPRTLPRDITIAGLWNEAMQPLPVMRLQFLPYGPAPAYTVRVSSGSASFRVTAPPVGSSRVIPDETPNHDPASPR